MHIFEKNKTKIFARKKGEKKKPLDKLPKHKNFLKTQLLQGESFYLEARKTLKRVKLIFVPKNSKWTLKMDLPFFFLLALGQRSVKLT